MTKNRLLKSPTLVLLIRDNSMTRHHAQNLAQFHSREGKKYPACSNSWRYRAMQAYSVGGLHRTTQTGKIFLSQWDVRTRISNNRSLSNCMQGSQIDEIPDVDVGSTSENSYINDEAIELTHVLISAILNLDYCRACMRCKSRVEPIAFNQGRCTTHHCRALQRYYFMQWARSRKTATQTKGCCTWGYFAWCACFCLEQKLMIKDISNTSDYSSINKGILLSLPPFSSIKYNKNTFLSQRAYNY